MTALFRLETGVITPLVILINNLIRTRTMSRRPQERQLETHIMRRRQVQRRHTLRHPNNNARNPYSNLRIINRTPALQAERQIRIHTTLKFALLQSRIITSLLHRTLSMRPGATSSIPLPGTINILLPLIPNIRLEGAVHTLKVPLITLNMPRRVMVSIHQIVNTLPMKQQDMHNITRAHISHKEWTIVQAVSFVESINVRAIVYISFRIFNSSSLLSRSHSSYRTAPCTV